MKQKKRKNNSKDLPKKNTNRFSKTEKEHKKPFKKFIITIVFIVLLFFAVSLGFKLYNFYTLAKEMFYSTPSKIYDENKNLLYEIGVERNREKVTYSGIPKNLVNAYISIEDERFFSHHGVDLKRTGAAIITYIFKRGNSSFGGSTITQQLVKNITGDDSNSASRKVKEWGYAFVLESAFSKEEILEAYFNIIYTGPNIYGIGSASKYYFNKNVSDLSLAESAFLAGLTHSPNSYNPFSDNADKEKIAKRTRVVLYKMLELKHITQEEYDNAVLEVNNGLKFEKGFIKNNDTNITSYHTDAVINEIISDLAKKKKISNSFATNYFYLSGSNIYSTVNTELQNIVEKECNQKKYILNSSINNETSQVAFVITDNKTGFVVACVGGLGSKENSRSFNRVTQMRRQTGSSMKPVAVLLPAIAEKKITPTSIFDDSPTTFVDYEGNLYTPIDYDNYKGSITLRQAVETSQNIPFVKIMEQITPQVSIKYLKKMGITSLKDKDVNLSLALGGLDEGISPLEFVASYETIANDGTYIEPTFYTKITSINNSVILESTQSKRNVVSKDVSCILKQLLTEPVNGSNGTATYCKIPSMDVSAKTGTTNENYDRWLCGFTNYYTAVCWYGFDQNESIEFKGQNPAGLIWAEIMQEIHKKLPASKFEITNGVVKKTICKDSGMIANSDCKNTYTEYFLKDNVPNSPCLKH